MGLRIRAQAPDLPRCFDIAREKDKPAHLEGADEIFEVGVEGGSIEPDHEPLAGELFRVKCCGV